MKHLLSKINLAIVAIVTLLSSPLQASADDDNAHTIITSPVPQFSEIRIIGESSDYSRRLYGYPGVTVTRAQDNWGYVSYNSFCSKYVKAEVNDGVLTVTIDCKFLSPNAGWHPVNGMIEAITIAVPSDVKLKSIVNEGAYYTNMTLIGINQQSLSVTSSNTTNIIDCKIKNLSWQPFDNRPLAAVCDFNLSLTRAKVGELTIPAAAASNFKTNITFGSEIKKVFWVQ